MLFFLSLSVLSLEGVKYGDFQMTVTGIFVSCLFLFVTRSEPCETLSAQRPFKSIFNLYMFFSLLGQFATHMGSMYVGMRMAQSYTTLQVI